MGSYYGEFQAQLATTYYYIPLNKSFDVEFEAVPFHVCWKDLHRIKPHAESCARRKASTPSTPHMCHVQCFYTIIFHLRVVYFVLCCWGFLCPFLCDEVRTSRKKKRFCQILVSHTCATCTLTQPLCTCMQTDTLIHAYTCFPPL